MIRARPKVSKMRERGDLATGDGPAPSLEIACLELNSIETYDLESLGYYESDQSENSDLETYLNLESLPVQLNAMSIREQESIYPKVKIKIAYDVVGDMTLTRN